MRLFIPHCFSRAGGREVSSFEFREGAVRWIKTFNEQKLCNKYIITLPKVINKELKKSGAKWG
jgi:hypothetical protein